MGYIDKMKCTTHALTKNLFRSMHESRLAVKTKDLGSGAKDQVVEIEDLGFVTKDLGVETKKQGVKNGGSRCQNQGSY